MAATKTVYEQLIEAAYEYLGPAAKRFIDREIEAHLGKKPQDIVKEDIATLHDWCRLALALLTEDSTMVDDFSQNLLAIADGRGD